MQRRAKKQRWQSYKVGECGAWAYTRHAGVACRQCGRAWKCEDGSDEWPAAGAGAPRAAAGAWAAGPPVDAFLAALLPVVAKLPPEQQALFRAALSAAAKRARTGPPPLEQGQVAALLHAARLAHELGGASGSTGQRG